MRKAARILDPHECPLHVGGLIRAPGVSSVVIGYLPAATLGASCICLGPSDMVVGGSTSVTIGGLPAAREGDPTLHGGKILSGCPNVLIGD